MLKRLCWASLVACLSIQGATLEYTNRATWEQAAGEVSSIDFQGTSTTTDSNGLPSLTVGSVTFTGLSGWWGGPTADPNLSVIDPATAAWEAAWEPGDALMANIPGLSITLPAGTKAVGFDMISTFLLFAAPGTESFFNVELADGERFYGIPDYGPPERTFLGFISTDDISELYVGSTGSFPMIGNFSFVGPQIAVAPEPTVGTSILLALLLLSLGKIARSVFS